MTDDPRYAILAATINFRIEDDTRDDIDKWAAVEGRTRSDMARVLIEEALAGRNASQVSTVKTATT